MLLNKGHTQCANFLALMLLPTLSWGAAFQIQEQSAALLGTAFSGTSVLAQDASTAYYNPAGLTDLYAQQVSMSNVVIRATPEVKTTNATANMGATVQGRDHSPAAPAVIPGLYYSYRATDKWAFGLGATVPFGLKTEYDKDSNARYIGTRSQLTAFDVTPNIAYRFNDRWSLGMGADHMYIKANLDMRIDSTNDGIPDTDSFQKNVAEDWAVSYHFGVLYQYYDFIRAGITYHGPVPMEARGQSKNTFTNTIQDVGADATLPEWISASARFRLAEYWHAMAETSWTRWSRIDALTLDFESGISTVLPLEFTDVYRFALGMTYEWNDDLLLRMGVSYEQSPVNDAHRTPRVPDSDRTWVALGARYDVTKRMHVDFGYAHIFFKKSHIDDHGPVSSLTNSSIFPLLRYQGTVKAQADLVGLQLSWDYV